MSRYVDDTYIKFIQEELNDIKDNLKNIKSWKKEYQAINDKEEVYQGIDISKMGYKTSSTWTLDNILIGDEARKNILESNIIKAQADIRSIERYINMLDDEQKELIESRYFVTTKKNLSFENIRKNMYCSKQKVLDLHEEAINELAYYKYQCIANALQNQDTTDLRPIKDHNRTENAVSIIA